MFQTRVIPIWRFRILQLSPHKKLLFNVKKKNCVKFEADRMTLTRAALHLQITIDFKWGKTCFLVFYMSLDRENS